MFNGEEHVSDDWLGPWPCSMAFWMNVLFMAFFLIRPWEVLYPWMGVVPIERIIALATIAVVILGGSFRCRCSAATLLVVALMGVMAVGAKLALDTEAADVRLYIFLTFAVHYFLFVSMMRTPRAVLAMATWWIIVMYIYILKSLWEYQFNERRAWAQGVPRMIGIESTFGMPNEFAASICLTFPMLVFVYRSRAAFGRHFRPLLAAALGVYLILGLRCVQLTNSRSGIVKVLVFLVLALLGIKGTARKLKTLAGICALLVACASIMPAESWERVRTIWDQSAGPKVARDSAHGRIEGFLMGVEMFKREPLFGVGVGNFIPYRLRFLDGVELEAHNLYGQVLGETGLVGTMLFGLLVLSILSQSGRVIGVARDSDDPRLQLLSNCAVACRDTIILLLTAGFFGHNLCTYHWFWIAAFITAAHELAGNVLEERRWLAVTN
jgi:O-antigen ligase